MRPGRDRKSVKRGPGKRIVEGGSFRLADEVRYIQHRAADHDGRIVTIGQLVLFSTETGDAWLLDRTDFLAASSPEMAKPNRSRSWKPRPRLPSNGRATIASMGRRSSIRIGIPVASSPSSGTQPTNSLASNSAATLNTAQAGNFKYVWLALPIPARVSRSPLSFDQNFAPTGAFRAASAPYVR